LPQRIIVKFKLNCAIESSRLYDAIFRFLSDFDTKSGSTEGVGVILLIPETGLQLWVCWCLAEERCRKRSKTGTAQQPDTALVKLTVMTTENNELNNKKLIRD